APNRITAREDWELNEDGLSRMASLISASISAGDWPTFRPRLYWLRRLRRDWLTGLFMWLSGRVQKRMGPWYWKQIGLISTSKPLIVLYKEQQPGEPGSGEVLSRSWPGSRPPGPARRPGRRSAPRPSAGDRERRPSRRTTAWAGRPATARPRTRRPRS